MHQICWHYEARILMMARNTIERERIQYEDPSFKFEFYDGPMVGVTQDELRESYLKLNDIYMEMIQKRWDVIDSIDEKCIHRTMSEAMICSNEWSNNKDKS